MKKKSMEQFFFFRGNSFLFCAAPCYRQKKERMSKDSRHGCVMLVSSVCMSMIQHENAPNSILSLTPYALSILRHGHMHYLWFVIIGHFSYFLFQFSLPCSVLYQVFSRISFLTRTLACLLAALRLRFLSGFTSFSDNELILHTLKIVHNWWGKAFSWGSNNSIVLERRPKTLLHSFLLIFKTITSLSLSLL